MNMALRTFILSFEVFGFPGIGPALAANDVPAGGIAPDTLQ